MAQIIDASGNTIAVVEESANAPAIAAAPELLEALKLVHAEMGSRISLASFAEFSEDCKRLIETAIARAEGRES